VQAVVIGRGEIEGIPFGHSWLEAGDLVYDYSNGNSVMIKKERYYELGGARPDEPTLFKRYTLEEYRERVIETGAYYLGELDCEH
jgi:hypothetical protein